MASPIYNKPQGDHNDYRRRERATRSSSLRGHKRMVPKETKEKTVEKTNALGSETIVQNPNGKNQ